MPAPVIPPTCPGANRLTRAGYHGGRVSLFWRGPAPGAVHQLDVTGIYGSVMMRQLLPVRLTGYWPSPNPRSIERAAAMGEVCAAVKVDSPHALPYLSPARQMSWERGRMWTVLCGPELARAVREGHVHAWGPACRYALAPVCRAFAERWWAARQMYRATGDPVLAALAKAMPCYLYGRWALRRSEWVEISHGPDGVRWDMGWRYQAETRAWQQQRILDGVREVLMPRGESRYSMPAISAWITSHARVLMDGYRTTAGETEVYYQVVDSLHVSSLGYQRLLSAGAIDPQTPGALRHEREHQVVTYLGRNCLIVDGALKASGLPGLRRLLPDGSYQAITWDSLESILERGPDGTVRYRERPFTLPRPPSAPGRLATAPLMLW